MHTCFLTVRFVPSFSLMSNKHVLRLHSIPYLCWRSYYIMTYDHMFFVAYSQGVAYKAAMYCCIAWKRAWSFAKREFYYEREIPLRKNLYDIKRSFYDEKRIWLWKKNFHHEKIIWLWRRKFLVSLSCWTSWLSPGPTGPTKNQIQLVQLVQRITGPFCRHTPYV